MKLMVLGPEPSRERRLWLPCARRNWAPRGGFGGSCNAPPIPTCGYKSKTSSYHSRVGLIGTTYLTLVKLANTM